MSLACRRKPTQTRGGHASFSSLEWNMQPPAALTAASPPHRPRFLVVIINTMMVTLLKANYNQLWTVNDKIFESKSNFTHKKKKITVLQASASLPCRRQCSPCAVGYLGQPQALPPQAEIRFPQITSRPAQLGIRFTAASRHTSPLDRTIWPVRHLAHTEKNNTRGTKHRQPAANGKHTHEHTHCGNKWRVGGCKKNNKKQ